MTEFAILRNIQPRPELVREDIKKDPGFGQYFTDHMAHIRYTNDDGWQAHEVKPYGPLVLDPAAAVFHYAQEIFEGLKAYRHADGSVWTFRPDRNAARINRSAERLAPPAERRGLHQLAQGARLDRREVGADAGHRRRRIEPLPAPVHDRLGAVPRSARQPRGRLLRHRFACRTVLRRRHQARVDLAVEEAQPRRRRRHRLRQVRRQLRVLGARAEGGRGEGPPAGALHRRRGAQVHRRARRHEPHARDQGRGAARRPSATPSSTG